MHDHELDLIGALVEGRLADESEARALIASSPELQAEYETQRTAYEALSSAGPEHLTESESAALRRDLWTVLRAEAKPKRAPWLYRLLPITAGVFVIVVVGLALAGDENETAASREIVGGDTASVTTTAAALAEATAGAAAPTTISGATDGAETTAELDSDLFTAAAKALRTGTEPTSLEAPTEDEDRIVLDDCLAEADLEGYTIVESFDSELLDQSNDPTPPGEGLERYVAAIPGGSELDTAPITFVDTETCEVVFVDG